MLKAFHRNDTIDLLLIAVRPDLQKKGVNAVIISKVMHGCFKIGVKQAETGPMLEPMRLRVCFCMPGQRRKSSRTRNLR